MNEQRAQAKVQETKGSMLQRFMLCSLRMLWAPQAIHMSQQSRFANLKGHTRKWLEAVAHFCHKS